MRAVWASAATSCHALIPRSPAVGVRLRVRLFGALGRVRDASGFPSVPFPRTQGKGGISFPILRHPGTYGVQPWSWHDVLIIWCCMLAPWARCLAAAWLPSASFVAAGCAEASFGCTCVAPPVGSRTRRQPTRCGAGGDAAHLKRRHWLQPVALPAQALRLLVAQVHVAVP
jgi:hypothetical protein